MKYTVYFYRFLRTRMLLLALFSVIIGILDGFGLSMFMPLLKLADGGAGVDSAEIESMRFLFTALDSAGIQITLKVVLLFLCVFFTLKGVVQFFGNAYIVTVQQYFVKTIRLKMIHSLSQILFKKFVVSDVGRIQNSLTGEVARLSNALRAYLGALQSIFLVWVYVGFAIATDVQFSLIVGLGGWLTNFLFRRIYKITKKGSAEVTRESHRYQGLMIQFVSSFKYLKATGSVDRLKKQLTGKVEAIEGINKRIGIMAAIVSAMREPTMIIIVALAIFFKTAILGDSLGTIILSLLFFYRALAALVAVQTQYNTFLTYSGSIENMADFQKDLDSGRETQGSRRLERFDNSIELVNAEVRYDSRKVLNGITFKVEKNATVAIVGESGSGKTTFVNVLAALLPLDGGEMKVDGIASSHLNRVSYQKRIGYITQEPIIFNASIFDNITFWDEPTPENRRRFEAAIEKAQLVNFINTLPEKESTELGNNGINISGGQKQRISIARELYKDVDILIMDEATSALDSETERAIQKNIEQLKGAYTMFIVAHRLSTVKHADRIVIMKNGSIANEGTYYELIEKSPDFKKLVALQELN